VRRCLASWNNEEVVTAPRSPWQNPYGERLIGSIRSELLDPVIVGGERHRHRLLSWYFASYPRAWPHLGLGHDAPEPGAVEPPARGRVIAEPMLGGWHQRYRRCGGVAASAGRLLLCAGAALVLHAEPEQDVSAM
jgi:hypothetical protein